MSTQIVNERPVLFSGPMVRAILSGAKTQTRRVVKTPSWVTSGPHLDQWKNSFWMSSEHPNYARTWPKHTAPIGVDPGQMSPYGQPGDLLYVREMWRQAGFNAPKGLAQIRYRADGEYTNASNNNHWLSSDRRVCDPRWRPSIHMPKWAARIWLRVIDVRVERVQEIDPRGSVAEGAPREHAANLVTMVPRDREWFRALWDSINAKRGYGWDVNPWVWVVAFERCEAPR